MAVEGDHEVRGPRQGKTLEQCCHAYTTHGLAITNAASPRKAACPGHNGPSTCRDCANPRNFLTRGGARALEQQVNQMNHDALNASGLHMGCLRPRGAIT